MDFLELNEEDFQVNDNDLFQEYAGIQDEETILPTNHKSSVLNNQDYTLNSPLNLDTLDPLYEFLTRGVIHPLKSQLLTKNLKTWYDNNKLPNIGLKKPTTIHNFLGKMNLREPPPLLTTREFLKSVDFEADITFWVPQEFLRLWIGKDVTFLKTQNIPNSIVKWLHYFLILHPVTLMSAASTSSEEDNLCETYGFKKVKGVEDHFEFDNNFFGKILIVKNLVYFVKENLFIDRNVLMMFKDLYLARFHTLLSTRIRYDDRHDLNSVETMSEIYTIGDAMLEEYGNEGYNCIKLVEPLCNLRFAQLACATRPLIPSAVSFNDHLQETCALLAPTNRYTMLLKDCILNLRNQNDVAMVFGSYRHWGHPFVDYMTGLQNLHDRVKETRKVNAEYAEKLASDLAYIVLEKQFRTKKRWFVDKDLVPEDNMLKYFIDNNIWPTSGVIKDFEDNWHKLPLIKCFEIPDVVDLTQLYSDKTHSLTRSELINHINTYPNKPIPGPKVLKTLIETPARNWPEFLKEVNDNGFKDDDLVIGLREKERELKIEGRFFAMLSWNLRDYFVMTEYLIKEHFVPLFKGLTMADDLNTVTKKMVESSSGQGSRDYKNITIADSIDYDKWCNRQGGASSNPVFKVMGQFIGYPNLFTRTHEIFEKSLMYYKGRPDLFRVVDGILTSTVDTPMCWYGQYGGLEGLRQKGWSILSLLVIRRESMSRNTGITTLAQGDNQVIFKDYELQPWNSPEELVERINSIVANNDHIMGRIFGGIHKLGMIVNKDETMSSADFFSYGKRPVFRGIFIGLEQKKYSRVLCVTNDQLPNVGNVLATVVSNCLAVAHESPSPINAMLHYNWLGNFVRLIMEKHNPALRGPPRKYLPTLRKEFDSEIYKIAYLYLDPSVGGVGGMSLCRFMMRMFPDPISEALSFWKYLHDGTEKVGKKGLIMKMMNIKTSQYHETQFAKLIEKPESINIRKGVSVTHVLKENIKREFLRNSDKIQNHIIKHAAEYSKEQEYPMVAFLETIKPCFPRFISEFMSASYFGIVNSLIGLYQNSRTIRNQFKRQFSVKLDDILVKSEVASIKSLLDLNKNESIPIWSCSSSRADELRTRSWGRDIIGATIPHPLELLDYPELFEGYCLKCERTQVYDDYLNVFLPEGMVDFENQKGPYMAYLGSKTSSTTSILQPWEKETNVPLIRRAAELRNTQTWFVVPTSALGLSITSNAVSLTGEDIGLMMEGASRTGTWPHRFFTERTSSGGFSAQNPSKLTRIMTTTDTMKNLKSMNCDFMYQPLILASQMTVGEIHTGNGTNASYHVHIKCNECIRGVSDDFLDSDYVMNFPDVSDILSSWKPDGTSWFKQIPQVSIPRGVWENVGDREKSFHVGRAEGFVFGDLKLTGDRHGDDSSLFPLSLVGKLYPKEYLLGILDGLERAVMLTVIHKRMFMVNDDHHPVVTGYCMSVIEKLTMHSGFQNLVKSESFMIFLSKYPHKIPASYPLNKHDISGMIRGFLKATLFHQKKQRYSPLSRDVWIFSDIADSKRICLSLIANKLMYASMNTPRLDRNLRELIRSLSNDESAVRNDEINLDTFKKLTVNHKLTEREIKHSIKDVQTIPEEDIHEPGSKIIKEVRGDVYSHSVDYISENRSIEESIVVPYISNPTISSLRLVQIATGSFYKINSILDYYKIEVDCFLSGGDGSGGITSLLLRKYKTSRGIFNSLLTMDNVNLKGSSPSPPSAVQALGKSFTERCVNYKTNWEAPNDLRRDETWEYFKYLKRTLEMRIDLAVFDMELQSETAGEEIEIELSRNISRILERNGTLIFKTYLHRILNRQDNILSRAGPMFEFVDVVQTEFSSSQTSEVYVLMRNLHKMEVPILYPDLTKLAKELSNSLCFKSDEEEFERALGTLERPQLGLYPRNLKGSPTLELATILQTMGVETGSIYEILYKCPQNVEDRYNYLVSALLLSFNHISTFTKLHTVIPHIPSDGKVGSLGVLYSAFYLIQSIVNKSSELNKIALDSIKRGFQVYFYPVKVLVTEITKDGTTKTVKWRLCWTFGKRNCNRKTISVRNKIAMIAGITRNVLKLLTPLKDKMIMDLTLIESYMGRWNESLNIKKIRGCTGIFDDSRPFVRESDNVHFVVDEMIDSDDDQEGALFD